jgi:ABC-type Fe3+/spermidine/putrescine transport system ATPase subunit
MVVVHIVVENLNKWFDKKHVLKGIDFTVEHGQFVALLGPSGCGKTTLLNILAGFLEIQQGQVRVGDETWCKPGFSLAPERRNVGMVFQDFALWPHMNIFENIAFGLKLRKMNKNAISDRVKAVLEMVQMDGYQGFYPHQISGGQKQRIAIARALAPSPSVLLMDEPLSSLDAKLREQMRWDMLDIIREAQITTVYVTHDQAEALSMADKILLMREGRIEQVGNPTDLYHQPHTPFAATFMGASNLLDGIVDSVIDDEVMRIDCHGHILHAKSSGIIGRHVQLSIRPTDIELFGELDKPEATSQMSVIEGTIAQRAFHGVHWRYRVRLVGTPEVYLEVWYAHELPYNGRVFLAVAAEKCLPLQSAVERLEISNK